MTQSVPTSTSDLFHCVYIYLYMYFYLTTIIYLIVTLYMNITKSFDNHVMKSKFIYFNFHNQIFEISFDLKSRNTSAPLFLTSNLLKMCLYITVFVYYCAFYLVSPVVFFLHQVIPRSKRHQVSVVRRSRDGHATRTAYVRMTQLVRQLLELVRLETIVVPQHVVMGGPASALHQNITINYMYLNFKF